MVWAYSNFTGGPLIPERFSLQFPQRVIQRTANQLLSEVDNVYSDDLKNKRHQQGKFISMKNSSFLAQRLPVSGIPLLSLIEYAAREEDYHHYWNTSNQLLETNLLIRILRQVPLSDIRELQKGVKEVAAKYSFYRFNSSLKSIPTAVHYYPDGPGMDIISKLLEKRKLEGIQQTAKMCELERNRKNIAYISQFPCQVYG